ncbi:MAG TPA: PstS family phosphate ABC transporter substrate-binding protein [Xanthomonadaceae bacterium]|nr:PstS family phosphate ABC transporter substrate-binding protein [Xanthomonadaceae bacterium]
MKQLRLPAALALAALVAACGRGEQSPGEDQAGGRQRAGETPLIAIDGSSTVYPVTEAVAEEFQIARKGGVRVTVGVSGTGGGFKKFCRGETAISNASRPILEQELAACQATGVEFIELPVAYDALTVVINPGNDWIQAMTVDQLKTIWQPEAQGTIMNWNQVEPQWPDRPLTLFGAGADSGTFDYFTEAVVGTAKASRGDFTASEDDNVLVTGVANDVNALGFFGFAYYLENRDKIRAVPIKLDADAPAVLPALETVKDGTYQPLSRPIFIYVNAKALAERAEVREFVAYYLGEARPLIEEVGYIPLPERAYELAQGKVDSGVTGTVFEGHSEVGVSIEDLLQREPR